MKFKNSRFTNKEVLRRAINAYLVGDDSFIHSCQTFRRMKMHDDCFAEFGLTTEEVLHLSEVKQEIMNQIDTI